MLLFILYQSSFVGVIGVQARKERTSNVVKGNVCDVVVRVVVTRHSPSFIPSIIQTVWGQTAVTYHTVA